MSTTKKEKINISQKLKQLRNYKAITLKKLAEVLETNYSSVERYEFRNNTPQLPLLIKIANYFGFTVDYLLTDSSYLQNIKLFELGEKIDKLESSERFKIETIVETLLKKEKRESKSSFDTIDLELQETIHKNIKILRESEELSQRQLSSQLNKSPAFIRKYEDGSNNPSPNNLLVLSEFFNVSIHYLITGRKLYFHFRNEAFKDTMLKADTQLTLEQHKFIIELMTNVIEQA